MVDEFEFFLEKAWSDGLPVVTPTEERVQRMLIGTQLHAEDVIGDIPPLLEPATVRTVAIHAVMAGCKPAYLPVVLGGLRLMLREEFNLNGVQGTMHGVAPLMIVNGPYAHHIGIHGGNGCFGPGFRANASIGRAIRLVLLNLGGGIAGLASATVFATPLRYTACLTENSALSPWESLAVSKGYAPEANVITCVMVESPRLCFDDVSQDPMRLLTGLASSMTDLCSWNMHARSDMKATSRAIGMLCVVACGRRDVQDGGLHGHRAVHRHPIHESPLGQRIILDGPVLGTAIVPHEQIAHLPLMPVQKGGTGDELGQLLNEG